MLLYAHTKRTTPIWKQDMPRRRVSVPQVKQRLPLWPYRKHLTSYVMVIDSTITLRNSYAQSRCNPVSWYYMLYSSIHNIYLIYGYTVIEYTYLFQKYSTQTIKSRKRAPITIIKRKCIRNTSPNSHQSTQAHHHQISAHNQNPRFPFPLDEVQIKS